MSIPEMKTRLKEWGSAVQYEGMTVEEIYDNICIAYEKTLDERVKDLHRRK